MNWEIYHEECNKKHYTISRLIYFDMYSLIHGFYKYMVKKDEFCVLILGLDDAGKTVSIQTISIAFSELSFLDVSGSG